MLASPHMERGSCRVWARHSESGCSLLSGDTESSAGSACGLGLLTSDLVAPEVSQTSVSSDLLESLQILSELGVDTVGDELRPVAFTDISLSVKEPLGDVVVSGLGKDVVDLFNVCFSQLTSSTNKLLIIIFRSYLLLRSIWAILRTRLENLLPIPLMALKANMALRLPSTFVFWTLRMWTNSSALTRWNEVD